MIDWIVSLASLLVSIVAIVISIQQTRLSNKQQLFEKRADKYIEICELINNCKNTMACLNQKMILRTSTLLMKIWNYNFCYDLIKEEFSECLSEEIEARLNHEAEELQLSQQCDALLKVAKQIEQDDILLSLKKSIRL